MVFRVRCVRCCRRAITRYEVAAANAREVWRDGRDCWLSGSLAAVTASLVYSTGRLRRTSTLSHSVEAAAQLAVFANTAKSPCHCSAGRPCSPANAVNPATPARTTSLATSPVAETRRSAQRSTPGSVPGSQGAQDGAPCGSPRAAGSTYNTPAVPTDTASPHVTRYGATGACPTIGRGARTRASTAKSPRCMRAIPPNSLSNLGDEAHGERPKGSIRLAPGERQPAAPRRTTGARLRGQRYTPTATTALGGATHHVAEGADPKVESTQPDGHDQQRSAQHRCPSAATAAAVTKAVSPGSGIPRLSRPTRRKRTA